MDGQFAKIYGQLALEVGEGILALYPYDTCWFGFKELGGHPTLLKVCLVHASIGSMVLALCIK